MGLGDALGGAAAGAGAGSIAGPVGAIVGAGIGAVSSIFGSKKQSDASTQNTAAQIAAQNHAADVQAKSAADALAFQKQQAALSAAQAEAIQKANYDQWAARQNQLNSLNGILGIAPRQIPAYQPLPTLNSDGTIGSTLGANKASTSATGTGSDPVTFAKSLLDSGMAPQDVASKVNSQFNLGTGSQAVYYDPSAHGGVATIGLPNAYLAQDGTGGTWTITQRAGASASKTPYTATNTTNTLASLLTPSLAYTPTAPGVTAPSGYTPPARVFGSIGSML